jgi:hypothetical protein
MRSSSVSYTRRTRPSAERVHPLDDVSLRVVGERQPFAVRALEQGDTTHRVAHGAADASARITRPDQPAEQVVLVGRRLPLAVGDAHQVVALVPAGPHAAPHRILRLYDASLVVCHVPRRDTGWILNPGRIAVAVPPDLPSTSRAVHDLDELVLSVEPSPGLLAERVALPDAVAALVVPPLGFVPLLVRLTELVAVLVPDVLLRVPVWPHLFLHEPTRVAPVARDAAAAVRDRGEVAVLVVGDATVVNVAWHAFGVARLHGPLRVFAPRPRAPALGVVPAPLEVEREAALVGLLDHHAAAVFVA